MAYNKGERIVSSEMRNQEILEKAIQKAIDNGWTHDKDGHWTVKDLADWYSGSWQNQLIFSHDFAKALWLPIPTYDLVCSTCEAEYNWWDDQETEKLGFPPSSYCNADGTKLEKKQNGETNPWWGHLRSMVISDDPIQYLGEHI